MNEYTRGEGDCCWYFAKMDENTSDTGPNEPMEDNFRKTPYASLIREAVQNSLDAVKDPSKPVVVSFKIRELNVKNFPKLLEVKKHIQACLEYYSNNASAPKIYEPMLEYINDIRKNDHGKMMYIQVSDSNTKGMDYVEGRTDTTFYSFVRSVGVSSKNETGAGGSYGYGKAAYFYISPIRTLVVSTQAENGNCYFAGVSNLCTHRIDGVKRTSIGYYGTKDGKPIIGQPNIPYRFLRKDGEAISNESGTDINIMGVKFEDGQTKEDLYNQMIDAALSNFWMAIIRKKLIVEIGETVIDASNIEDLMQSRFTEEHDRGQRKGQYNPRPFLNTVLHVNEDNNHRLFIKDLNTVDKLSEYAPNKDWGTLEFYVWKNRRANNRCVYMRSILMSVKVSGVRNGEGYYGVLVCPGGYANEILREMEDPAHKEWSTKLVDKSIRRAAKALDEEIGEFIKQSIRELFKLDEIEVAKIRGIEQYLYIPTEVEDEPDEEEDTQSSITGNSTGMVHDDGTSLTTVGGEMHISPVQKEKQSGKVVIKQNTNAAPDEKGNMMSGRGSKKIQKPNTSNHVSGSKPKQRNSDNEDAQEGSYMVYLPVRYRAFSIKKDGKLMHKIIIHAKEDVERAQIDILVGGEVSDSKIRLAYASEGIIDKNCICDVPLNSDKPNVFTVQFADNLKHAIKIEAYEIK